MRALETMLSHAIWQTLGWTLIHSIWQASLVALGYKLASVVLRRHTPQARYAVAGLCLLLTLALPAATFVLLRLNAEVAGRWAAVSAPRSTLTAGAAANEQLTGGQESLISAADAADGDAVEATAATETWAEEYLVSALPWLALLWMTGAAALSLRLAGGWVLNERLRHSRTSPAPVAWQETLARLSRRLRLSRPVRLCVSAFVEVPTVVGWLRPVILVPAGALLGGLSAAQLEALLAHELAHVRRHDYLFNLLQSIVEIFLFYHPAVWWLSQRVRAEREYVCDDLAVAATGDVLLYARALTTLEQLRRREGSAALVVAADGGSLMYRIQRLIRKQPAAPRRHPLVAAGLSAALLFALAGAFAGAHAMAVIDSEDPPAPAFVAGTTTADPIMTGGRKVAVTFVGLPVSQMWSQPRAEKKTGQLLARLNAHSIPATGFVTAQDLYKKDDGQLTEERINLLRLWLDAGMDLGVSSYSHQYFYKSSLAEFQKDVERGEQVTRKLLEERGRKVRYFSYPYLNTGPDGESKEAFEKFLAGRGYQTHPVTIDNMDWLYGKIYNDAERAGDKERMRRVASEYVPYMESMFEFYEQLSRDVVGYEAPQVLMLTANSLNADKFDDLVAMMKRRGYTFITLEEAVQDKAYQQPDTYTGPTGISWLQRWAITKGGQFRKEPYLSDFMSQFDPKRSGSDFKTRKGQ